MIFNKPGVSETLYLFPYRCLPISKITHEKKQIYLNFKSVMTTAVSG
jgi:hypothetical protein